MGDPTAYPHEGEGKITSRKSWSIDEIRRMGSLEYAQNMRNPDFVAAVDALPSRFEKTEEPSA